MTAVPRLPRQGFRRLEEENDMTSNVGGRRGPVAGLALLAVTLTACGGNLGSGGGDAADADELRQQWTGSLDSYRRVTEQYGIDLSAGQ
jgi:hypothetical protein